MVTLPQRRGPDFETVRGPGPSHVSGPSHALHPIKPTNPPEEAQME